jgi:4-hydroxy-tetrahydrodipicolinate synthase
MTHVGISLGLIEQLLKRYPATIAGLKDSSGDFDNTLAVVKNFPQLRVFPASA